MDWMARPTEDRWHETPTALMGGIAIWGGATVGLFLAPWGEGVWELWAGGALLFLSGPPDDLNGLSPVAKALAQVAGWELAAALPRPDRGMSRFGTRLVC